MSHPLIKPLRFGQAFSGIGGFEVGFARAGIDTVFQIEWDKHCQTVLQHRFPNTPLMGDIKHVTGSDLGQIDGLCGGFPCQNTSIAAPHRLGLAGEKSEHFHEFTRLVGEYQRLVDALNPRWVVIENPPGLLASPKRTGADMATVVRALEELGYGWAYRVVDGRHFGLPSGRRSPQRRKRVIVVGHRGGDPRPAWQVLGDDGADLRPASPRGGSGSTLGLSPDGGAVFDAVWRKSARPTKSLAAGGFETWVADGMANTLTGFDGGLATRQTHLVSQGGRVRTLTPVEWERLQGFDDDWTEGIPENARYTALGNAMHTGMAEWLGRRLTLVNATLPQINPIGAFA